MISPEIYKEINKAIDVEVKNQYINIDGHKCSFSEFIYHQLTKIYKLSGKQNKWFLFMQLFDTYSTSNVIARKRMIENLQEALKKTKIIKIPERKTTSEKIENRDINTIKGFGDKTSYLLKKLGIFSIDDLIQYYPRKYINYQTRKPIRNLVEGEDVTIFAEIKQVSSYNTKKNLSVLTVTLKDETGVMNITYFYAKANRYMMERYKSQFPIGANVLMSGHVKRDNYTGLLTLDKPQHQIISLYLSQE